MATKGKKATGQGRDESKGEKQASAKRSTKPAKGKATLSTKTTATPGPAGDRGKASGRRSAAETAQAQAEASRRAAEKAEKARARYRRPQAGRTGPVRDWSGWFRPSSGGDRAGGSTTTAEGEDRQASGDTVIDRGVDLGYRVVEEHIRQGQRTASKINERSYGPQEVGEDLWELGQRMVKDYTDFMALWLDFFTSSASSLGGGGFDFFGRSRQDRRPSPARRGGADGERQPSVAVASSRPAWGAASLDAAGLDAVAAGRSLVVSALHPAGGDGAPLTDVRWQPAEGGSAARFRVRVPPDQPPGLYDGVVRDGDSQALCGALRVEVEALDDADGPGAAVEDRAGDG